MPSEAVASSRTDIARPAACCISVRPAPPGFRDLQERYQALAGDFGKLLEMPGSSTRDTLAADVYKRATEIVDETNWEQPAPVVILGVAARIGRRWSSAEAVFRRATERWPEKLDYWLELTWALASLERLDEAETAARHAVKVNERSPAAHGNLASVLLQQNRPEEALHAIQRALEIDSSDASNQKILSQVRDALRQPVIEDAVLPWYKRLFR